MSAHKAKPETQAKVDAFIKADKAFQDAWDAFLDQHRSEIEYLDQLRESRNLALDEASRSVRDEADELDIMKVKSIRIGPFSCMKKKSTWYIPEAFVAKCKDRGLYDDALKNGAVAEVTTVDYAKGYEWLDSLGLTEEFLDCEDGKELTPAVSGPKPIPGFGVEAKKKG